VTAPARPATSPAGDAVRHAKYEQEAPPSAAAPAADPIEQLAALKDQGILTDEGFAARKAKILGG
jgi:hypothetical protein